MIRNVTLLLFVAYVNILRALEDLSFSLAESLKDKKKAPIYLLANAVEIKTPTSLHCVAVWLKQSNLQLSCSGQGPSLYEQGD